MEVLHGSILYPHFLLTQASSLDSPLLQGRSLAWRIRGCSRASGPGWQHCSLEFGRRGRVKGGNVFLRFSNWVWKCCRKHGTSMREHHTTHNFMVYCQCVPSRICHFAAVYPTFGKLDIFAFGRRISSTVGGFRYDCRGLSFTNIAPNLLLQIVQIHSRCFNLFYSTACLECLILCWLVQIIIFLGWITFCVLHRTTFSKETEFGDCDPDENDLLALPG